MSSVTEHDNDIFRQLQSRKQAIQTDGGLSTGAKQRKWSQELQRIQTFMVDHQKLPAAPLTPPLEGADGMLATSMTRIPSRKRVFQDYNNGSQPMQRSITQLPETYQTVSPVPLRRYTSTSTDRLSSLSTSAAMYEYTAPDLSCYQQNISPAINVTDSNAYTTYDPADFLEAYNDAAYGCAMKRQCTNASDMRSKSSHAITSASSDDVSFSFTSNSSALDSQTSYAHSACDDSHFWQHMSRKPSNCTSVDIDTCRFMKQNSDASFSSSFDYDNGSIFSSSVNAQFDKQNQDDLLFSSSDDPAAQLALIDNSQALALGTNVGLFGTSSERDLLTDVVLDNHYASTYLQYTDLSNDVDLAFSGTTTFSPATFSSSNGSTSSMERSQSQQSSITIDSISSEGSSSSHRATNRRRKHIENSNKQNIAPRSSDGPASVPMTRVTSGSHSTDSQAGKQAIPRATYRRPKVEKSFCQYCDEHPEGFHGVHELRRHVERLHTKKRKVWICVESKTSEEWPKEPLSNCKHCLSEKKYGVYYNAAAHIRRAHFAPRKRGRRPRGAEKESRAGKAGGNWPSIEWLKANGWLKEVTVTADESSALMKEEADWSTSVLSDDPESDEPETKQSIHESIMISSETKQSMNESIMRSPETKQSMNESIVLSSELVLPPQQQAMSSYILGLDACAPSLGHYMDTVDLTFTRASEAPAMQSSASCPGSSTLQNHVSISPMDELEERLDGVSSFLLETFVQV